MSALEYLHVDVFAPRAYSGNSLPVFLDGSSLDGRQMQAITQELRHFEAIFLTATEEAHRYDARVFDLFEELPFAGHPIIGAAGALHEASRGGQEQTWRFDLARKSVTVETRRTRDGYFGVLDQGAAEFLGEVTARDRVAQAFGLSGDDLDETLPLTVVSTGLRYLIVPVRSGALPRASIRTDITPLVEGVGAQFAVLFDEASLEVRHWNNDGVMEDIATGSAAGTIGAYRLRYGRAESGIGFILNQGRFTGRPSQLAVEAHGTRELVHSVKVGGDVSVVGRGCLEVRP